MSYERFPSGPWTGFYTYAPQDRHRMDLQLTFRAGRITGDGSDDVGRFLISGHYDPAEGECDWLKTYPGSHVVYYHGYREGKGIWGRWDIGLWGHGGFHIWPRGSEAGATVTHAVEHTQPAASPVPPALAPSGSGRG